MKNKISPKAKIIGLSIWMILFSLEGGFMVQSILPFILLMIIEFILRKKTKIKIDKPTIILFLFFLSIIISTIFNMIRFFDYASYDNFLGILYFFAILVWFWLSTNETLNKKDLDFITNSYTILCLILSIMVIGNYLQGATGKITIINLIGTEIDENSLSAIISVGIVYNFINLLNERKKLKITVYGILVIAIMFLGMTLTGSRAALLSSIISMFISFVIHFFRNKSKKKIITTILVIICIFIVGNKLVEYLPTWTYNRFFNSNYMDNSNNERLNIWKHAINGISESPVLGYGVNIFEKIPKFQTGIGIRQIGGNTPAHQTFLDIGIYSGLIGMTLFITFLSSIFIKFLNKERLKYLPVVLTIFLLINIMGIGKSAFLWTTLIFLQLIIKNEENSYKEVS